MLKNKVHLHVSKDVVSEREAETHVDAEYYRSNSS